MMSSPYKRFEYEELTVRDLLAIDRTIVANERTLLSYVRTSLTMMGAGAAILHFFDQRLLVVGGWVLLGLSVPTLVLGTWHYTRRRLALVPLVRRGLPRSPEPPADN